MAGGKTPGAGPGPWTRGWFGKARDAPGGVPVSGEIDPRDHAHVVVAALGGLARLGMVVHGVAHGRELHPETDGISAGVISGRFPKA